MATKTKLFGLLAGISIYLALSWLTAATTITSATFSFGGSEAEAQGRTGKVA